jgi:hypothetical protein
VFFEKLFLEIADDFVAISRREEKGLAINWTSYLNSYRKYLLHLEINEDPKDKKYKKEAVREKDFNEF